MLTQDWHRWASRDNPFLLSARAKLEEKRKKDEDKRLKEEEKKMKEEKDVSR